MSKKKPSGGEEFDALLGKLAQVPKAEADQRAKRWKKKRDEKKKKKPKQ